jgi:hypothetical protein
MPLRNGPQQNRSCSCHWCRRCRLSGPAVLNPAALNAYDNRSRHIDRTLKTAIWQKHRDGWLRRGPLSVSQISSGTRNTSACTVLRLVRYASISHLVKQTVITRCNSWVLTSYSPPRYIVSSIVAVGWSKIVRKCIETNWRKRAEH